MKKQILTKQDIQKEVLSKINKAKNLSIFLSVFLAAVIPLYIWFVKNYSSIMDEYTNHHGGHWHPALGFFIGPVVILLLLVFLCFSFIILYRAKKGKFTITKETLCYKMKEHVQYYKHNGIENALYFHCGRVSVDDEVYSSANVGDSFYIVILKGRKAPYLVYNSKHYEIIEERNQ